MKYNIKYVLNNAFNGRISSDFFIRTIVVIWGIFFITPLFFFMKNKLSKEDTRFFYIALMGSISLWLLCSVTSFNNILFPIWITVLSFITISLLIKRCHDIDTNPTWLFVLLVPVVNIIYFLMIALEKGSNKNSKYGNTPYDINNYKENFFKNVFFKK